MMTRNEEWIDRVNTAIQVMKDIQCETVSMRFTMKELIELKMMVNTINEMSKEQQKNV